MGLDQRILSETGTYHVMMRGNERKNLFQDRFKCEPIEDERYLMVAVVSYIHNNPVKAGLVEKAEQY